MNYFVKINEQEFGPYSLSDLLKYISSGNVLLTDLARTDNMVSWTSLSGIFEDQRTSRPFATLGSIVPVSSGSDVLGTGSPVSLSTSHRSGDTLDKVIAIGSGLMGVKLTDDAHETVRKTATWASAQFRQLAEAAKAHYQERQKFQPATVTPEPSEPEPKSSVCGR